MALKKFCNKQGCKHIVDITERYCAEHTHIIADTEASRQKRYDTNVRHERDAELSAFYLSNEWEGKRLYILSHYDGLDLYAYYIKRRIETATIVHHIRPLRSHYQLRLDDSNLIPVSARSHGEIEKLYKTKEPEMYILLFGLLERWKKEFGAY